LAVALVPLGLLASSWCIARRSGSKANFRRDISWAVVMLAVGVAWYLDQQSLWEQIRLALPDQQAPWTIEAANRRLTLRSTGLLSALA
jgi:hypothetical protein